MASLAVSRREEQMASYVPENNCTASALYVHFVPLYFVHWIQSGLALATLCICLANLPLPRWCRRQKSTATIGIVIRVKTANNNNVSLGPSSHSQTAMPCGAKKGQDMNFHVNVEILLAGALLYYAAHSVVMFGMHFGYVVLFHLPGFSDSDGCLYSISTWKCLLLRVPSYTAIAGFTFVHLALCVERAIASWHIASYEQFSARLGILLLFPMFLLPIGWNLWIFHNEILWTEKAYCMSSSAFSSPRLVMMSYILIGLDLLAVLIDFVLYAVNRQQKTKKTQSYSLRKSFQLRENDFSIRLILPISISHSLLFICSLTIYTSVKIVFDSADGLTYAAAVESAHLVETFYTLVSVGLFMILRRRLAAKINKDVAEEARLKKSEQSRLHAAQYQKFW